MSRQMGWLFVSVTAGCLLAGCNGSGGDYKTAKQIEKAGGKPVHDDEHGHGAGPHGGAIVELGDDEYHAEVVVDGKTQTLQVFLLGSDAKTEAATGATEATVVTEDQKSLTLKSAPQKGDAEGKTSRFELNDEEAVGALAKAGYLHGSLQLEIDGKPFRGDIDAHFGGSTHDDDADVKQDPAPTEEPSQDKPAE